MQQFSWVTETPLREGGRGENPRQTMEGKEETMALGVYAYVFQHKRKSQLFFWLLKRVSLLHPFACENF